MLGVLAASTSAREAVPDSPPSSSPLPKLVTAIEHVRRMRGGSQSHLMRCSDGHFYVVKFQNNPQGRRILINEYIGGKLARLLGLPCADICLVDVQPDLIRLTPELSFELPHQRVPVPSGLVFGSRYPSTGRGKDRALLSVVELRVACWLHRMKNLSALRGILMFDKWTGNTDCRQIICFLQATKQRRLFRILMIDNGFCFDGEAWQFKDAPFRGLYRDPDIYSTDLSIRAFHHWLERLETRVTLEELNRIVEEIPRSWFKNDFGHFRELINRLYARKKDVPALIQQTLTALKNRTSNHLARAAGAV